MQRADGGGYGGQYIPVPLEGFVVECESEEDAVAVRNADDILSGRDRGFQFPVVLDRLALILLKYGRQSAAEALSRRAAIVRADFYRSVE
jgi:hypothetical protein